MRVCGSGETNRFVFDNILGDPNRGSWAAFATIFQLDNNPADNLKGLQSSRINGNFPAGLSTNWPSATCNPPTIPGSGSVTVIDNSTTINPDLQYYFRRSDSGDITITRDQIITNIVTSAFNPNTHPVVVIHAVNGNINIAPNVTRIDAVLIASGDINTCNIADKGVWEKVPADGGCNNQLVINGAMVANKINFQRTWGSRFLAPPTTTHTTRVNLAPRDLDNDETAEVVNFPWYLHFITLPGFPNQAETQFDAYYSLPPRL